MSTLSTFEDAQAPKVLIRSPYGKIRTENARQYISASTISADRSAMQLMLAAIVIQVDSDRVYCFFEVLLHANSLFIRPTKIVLRICIALLS